MRRALWLGVMLGGFTGIMRAQEPAPAGGPTSYAMARLANYIPLETLRRTRSSIPAPLARRVTVVRKGALLQQVLLDIANQAELGLSYGEDLVRARVTVSVRARRETAAEALEQATEGTEWAVLVTRTGQVAVLRREPVQVGAIVGQVTDAKTGDAVGDVEVLIEGTRWRTLTGTDGRYRLDSVETGAHDLAARRIGYARQNRPVQVIEGGEATADFTLSPVPTKLDELVTVTPGGIQAAARSLPSPVSVVTSEDIATQGAQAININEVFRQVVPSGVGFAFPGSPQATILSVRGASSISGGSAMKIFVDGVEVADRASSPVDPSSIERVEVVRGPQAASLYGPDAAGGVVQIFTKRGTATGESRVDLRALAGVAQTPYAGRKSVLRQEYHASVQGGTPSAGYNIGGSFSRLGDWVPVDAPTAQSYPSGFAGLHYAQGIIDASLSARYLRTNLPVETNPELAEVGGVAFSRPQFLEQTWVNQTYGARFAVVPSRSWRNQLTVGYDESGSDLVQTQRRLTTPDDTLFQVSNAHGSKVSVQLNSSIQRPLGSSSVGTLTAGIDYYRSENSVTFVSGLLNTEGQLQTTPASFTSLANATVTNKGIFVQGEAGWRDAVFLTAGLRADDNSTFGDDLDTQVQPRVGVSGVAQWGQVTMKLRGAWGRAIRAPAFGQSLASVGGFIVQLANPALRPERQRGWDTGVDLYVGSRASLSLTWYDQTAEDLIASAVVAVSPTVTTQYRNLGRVGNQGLEVEGALQLYPVHFRAQYAYTHSRVEALGPDGVPGFEVGGEPTQIPVHTAGVTLTSDPWPGGSVAVGANYVGSYRAVDIVALLGCFAGNLPCPDLPTFENFIKRFDGFVKVNLTVTQRITPEVDALLTVNNLTNNTEFEAIKAAPVMGRLTQFGLHAHF